MKFEELLLKGIDTVIDLYQRYVSPALPANCRFEPTCSQYARDAFRKYGLFRGGCLALWRIMRCHPYSRGGYDPVR